MTGITPARPSDGIQVTLYRIPSTPQGTFGVLTVNGEPVVVTCEEPWNANRRNESCIPPGRYLCKPHNGKRFTNTWEVTGVPNRTAILFHTGNDIGDTSGCILPGLEFGEIDGLPAVLHSRRAMLKLRGILPRQFHLTVVNGVME